MRGKGFTLIELLITVSILSILMTIAIIYFGNVQKGARDAKRKSDISNIQSALEQYHSDQGYYPPTGGVSSGTPISAGSKTYLNKVPLDPTSGNYTYSASATSDALSICDNSTILCINYCLYATVENSSNAVLASICQNVSNQYQTQAP